MKKSDFLHDPFMRSNIIFFAGSMVVSVLNYLYHPVLSRFLSVSEFGDLEALLTIYGLVNILLGVFGKVVINNSAHSKEDPEELAAIRELYTIATIVVGFAVLALIVFSTKLTTILHFHSFYSIIVLAVFLFLTIPSTFQTSYLQGSHDFTSTSLINIFFSLTKLIFAVVLVLCGFGVAGAMAGLIVAQVCTVVYTHYKTKGIFKLTLSHFPSLRIIKKELLYSLLILLATGFVTLLYSSDIIVVKYFFDSTTAGLYSGISIISNVLFFVTGSIANVLLPSISRFKTKKDNHATLMKAFGLNFLIGGAALCLFVFFPSLIIKLLIGSKYLVYASYLPRVSLMIFSITLVNLFFAFFLALRNYSIMAIAILGLAGVSVGVSLFHYSINNIINTYLLTSLSILLLLSLFYIYYFFKNELHSH